MAVANLVNQLRSRIGLFVPRECHSDWAFTKWSAVHQGVRVKTIDTKDTNVRREVKEYMRDVFYKEAPIPKALGLSSAPAEVQTFLDKEMEIYLDSGGSLEFRIQESGELIGVGLVAIWAINMDYEVLGGNAGDWHQAAAVLAKERASEADPRVTWRDLQYQHIYNLCQRMLQQHPGHKGMSWAGMLSFKGMARALGLSQVLMQETIGRGIEDKVLLGCQSNFPGFDKVVYKNFPNPVLVDETRYADEELEVHGVKVLQTLSELGSMKFFVNLP